MPQKQILIALDSVGIDPLGHDRPVSVYSDSRFLFPRGRWLQSGDLRSGWPGSVGRPATTTYAGVSDALRDSG